MPIWPFHRSREDKDGDILLRLVAQASRNVAFYGPGRVPDTLEGRFELLTMFASLALLRLRAEVGAGPLIQSFTDAVFSQFDAGLREAAVGDLAVPKRMQKLAGSFYGRLAAYQAALQSRDSQALSRAIGRNVLGDENAPFAPLLADHAMGLAEKHAALPLPLLLTDAGWST